MGKLLEVGNLISLPNVYICTFYISNSEMGLILEHVLYRETNFLTFRLRLKVTFFNQKTETLDISLVIVHFP